MRRLGEVILSGTGGTGAEAKGVIAGCWIAGFMALSAGKLHDWVGQASSGAGAGAGAGGLAKADVKADLRPAQSFILSTRSCFGDDGGLPQPLSFLFQSLSAWIFLLSSISFQPPA